METIEFGGWSFDVREVARPEGWSCRVLVGADGAAFLAFLVSVGPYKIDQELIYRLSDDDYSAFASGALDVGALARTLAEDHEAGSTSRMSEDPQQFPEKFADEKPYSDSPGVHPDRSETDPEPDDESPDSDD